jgi:transposase
MNQSTNILPRSVDYDQTLILAIELSNKSWVLAAQVPGLSQTKAKRTIGPNKNDLLTAINGYRTRAAAAGRPGQARDYQLRGPDGAGFGWRDGSWRTT